MPLLTYPHCFLMIFCEILQFRKLNYSHMLFSQLRILISVQNDGHHGGFKFLSESSQALSLCQVALLYLTNLHHSPILRIPLLPIPIPHFPHLESPTSFSPISQISSNRKYALAPGTRISYKEIYEQVRILS